MNDVKSEDELIRNDEMKGQGKYQRSVREMPRWVQVQIKEEKKRERDEIYIFWERDRWRDNKTISTYYYKRWLKITRKN